MQYSGQSHSHSGGGRSSNMQGSRGGMESSIDISNHSVSMTLMEPSDSVVLRGHNCKIEIGPGITVSNMLITGHNNKIFSKGGQLGVVDIIDVMGHNNRIEQIIANNLKVNGHNNRFQHIQCGSINDTGICNQFNQCHQLQRQSQQRSNHQHQRQSHR